MKKALIFSTLATAMTVSACDITVEEMTPEDSRIYRETRLLREEIEAFNKQAGNTIEQQLWKICGDPYTQFRLDSDDLDETLASTISCRKAHFPDVAEKRKEDMLRLSEIRTALLSRADEFDQSHWIAKAPRVNTEIKKYRRMNGRLQDRLLRIVLERSQQPE